MLLNTAVKVEKQWGLGAGEGGFGKSNKKFPSADEASPARTKGIRVATGGGVRIDDGSEGKGKGLTS
jgi:hypothetical protein